MKKGSPLILIIASVLTGFFFFLFQGCDRPPEGQTCYLGVVLNTPSLSIKTQKLSPQFMGYRVDWSYRNPKAINRAILAHTALPYIIWEPQFWDDPMAMTLSSIINGEWDLVLEQWASVINALEYPVLIAFAPQVNNAQFPWHLTSLPESGEVYVAAFRYIVDFFKAQETFNVYWVWEISAQPDPHTEWNTVTLAYPGDEYVDWICVYGQNFGSDYGWSQWRSLEEIVSSTVDMVQRTYQKPIALRVDTTRKGGDLVQWLQSIPIQLQSSLSDVQLLLIGEDNYLYLPKTSLFDADLDRFQMVRGRVEFAWNIPLLSAMPVTVPFTFPNAITKGGYHWQGRSDLNSTVALSHSDGVLQIAIDLTDDHFIIQDHTNDNLVLGDSIELYINESHLGLNPVNSVSLWDLKNHVTIQESEIVYIQKEGQKEVVTTIQIELPVSHLTYFSIRIHDFDLNGAYTQVFSESN
jgi:hypothetical protein